MARADLLTDLVKYSLRGDKTMIKKMTEAIISEERSKQHNVLADVLSNELRECQNNKTNNNEIDTLSKFSSYIHESEAETYLLQTLPTRTMDSLILPKEVLSVCQQIIKEQFRTDLLRSYGLEPRHSVLMIGPPGNGKTSLAEAIAESMMIPLFTVRYDSIIGSYLGETALRLRKLINYVSTRKCVLFLDEFETLAKERGDTHDTGEVKRVVSSLLLQMDSLPSHVVIIGATNHPELLDRAVWRRFQIKINLPIPNRSDIELWLKTFQNAHKFRFGLSIESIANKLYGNSFSEIEEIGLSILRRSVMSIPNGKIDKIALDEIKGFNKRKSMSETNNL